MYKGALNFEIISKMANEVTFESILSGMAQDEIEFFIRMAEWTLDNVWEEHLMIPVWKNELEMANTELKKRKKQDGIS